MDDEIERLVIGVRADTSAFARDVDGLKRSLSGGLGDAAEGAGRRIETALVRAARTGAIGFDDLRRVALSVLDGIATSAVRGGIDAAGGGLIGLVGSLIGAAGAPGRATGGPVSPGRAYTVGERGPELFVPTASGRIEPQAGAPRDVRVSIAINAAAEDRPRALAQSGRQVARAVRRALEQAGN
jgi:hypothetical protein